MVYEDPDDPKKGISQPDLYQALAYAVRYKIQEIALLYPETITSFLNEPTGFTIRDEFADQVDVRITAWQLPVMNRELFSDDMVSDNSFHENFESTRIKLTNRLKAMSIPS